MHKDSGLRGWAVRIWLAAGLAIAALGFASGARAQEPPYFVTYSSYMEEPGNLEIALKNGIGKPPNGNRFYSATMELEYGVKAWWTTEFYLSGVAVANDSTIFTGYRWENRFRILPREHWINPVFYVEYEHLNLADRSLLEVVGHQTVADLALSNAQGRALVEKAFEMKLILSSQYKGWNFSENFITEKEVNDEPWEFGYALGVSRPLALAASSKKCVFCRENFSAGLELYGGLGDSNGFGWRATSQYLGPTVAFNIPKGPTLMFSPNFGLNANSLGVLYRFSASYEIQQFFSIFHK